MTVPEPSPWPGVARRIRVPSGFLFALLYLLLAKPTASSLGGSLALVLPGLLLRGYAAGYVQKNAELTMTGPYGYTRNPLYLGSMLAAYGFVAASRRWELAVLLTILLLIIYLPVILAEERFLRARFAAFPSYAARVPRLMPRLTSGSFGHNPGSFSSDLYRKHREYNALVGAALLYAVLLGVLRMHSHYGMP